ncbi:hypothetical protein [Blastococcus brunescens]|uniref:Uncharacterized protein n=1 Tax=Blastococcus brunescens TaxID=1564165 RepID=A0ABZ1B3E0_9ACTN|nr:hypothetical protein [Blastococcus sp. BMG 8361]WRL65308.1 hypothetical protein U6N30_06540 [Blastococcus sp. BMG 8361]
MDTVISAVIASGTGTVNVRSFLPDRDKGSPFYYGLGNPHEAAALVRSLAADGYYTIVNETVDVSDGGVSGVSLGGAVEFSPDDTPRAVEKQGTAALPHDLATRLLKVVYGFDPALPWRDGERLEFSVHPERVGFMREHTIWWETEQVASVTLDVTPRWPNKFSRHIGDKTYGLLITHLLDLPVPRTTVISRRVAPFTFGTPTGTSQFWTRTAPREQTPGHFSTLPYWVDPFRLLQQEDTEGDRLASVLAQEAVDALWSGASIPTQGDSEDLIEGVRGTGDNFMLGAASPAELPRRSYPTYWR